MRKLLAAATLAVGLAWAAAAPAQTEADFGKLFPSIVRVVGVSQTGVSLGSGVVVGASDAGSYVITNYHVLAGVDASQIRVVAPNGDKSGGSETSVSPARYVSGDSAVDLAVLYVPNFFAPPVPLAVGVAPENLSIRAIGYPGTDLAQWRVLKTTPTMTDGIVSTTATAPWRPGYPAVGQVQHTADLNGGMSGGPLMDLCGRVLGINTLYWSGANGVNLALSAGDITPYLQRQNIEYEAVKTTCDPAAAAREAAQKADQAAKEQARLEAEKEKARSAERLQAIIAAVVVVALGVGAFVLLRTRRRTGGLPSPPGAVTPPTPAGTGAPHGLMLKGIAEAAGKTMVLRAEDLAGAAGAEIGRNAGFGSPGTSRRHARMIWIAGQGFVLRDLGSMSGTRVNGKEIKGAGDQPINLGDVIEFGAPDARYSVEKL